jgi:hypothetical protein
MLISQIIVKSLKHKVAKALPAMQESLAVFQELDQSIDSRTRKKWQAQEDMAMEFRGDCLSVYNVKSEQGDFSLPQIHLMIDSSYSVPAPVKYSAIVAPTSQTSTPCDDTVQSWLRSGVALELEQ